MAKSKKITKQANVVKNKVLMRVVQYILLVGYLAVLFFLIEDSKWIGDAFAHTLTELFISSLAFFIGALSLVLYYTRRSNTFLFIGTGFLYTALLDLHHTFVTSSFYSSLFPSAPEFIEALSWNSSRILLGMLMFGSFLAWRREIKLGGEKGQIKASTVYWVLLVFSILAILFFVLYPVPSTFFDGEVFGAPEEFTTGFIFVITLVGYLYKGKWKKDIFEHWLVVFLIVSIAEQIVFTTNSKAYYDALFDAGHILKVASYLFVLIGLLSSMYKLFKQAQDDRAKYVKQNKVLKIAKKEADDAKEISDKSQMKITAAFDESIKSKQELEKVNFSMIGRELKMIELKKEIIKLKADLKKSK